MNASRACIVLAGSLADYPKGGGVWACFLQHVLGLKALGHDVFWLDIYPKTEDARRDEELVHLFFRRFAYLGLEGQTAVLVVGDPEDPELTLDSVALYGRSRSQVARLAADADLVWNFCSGLPRALLPLFRRRVFVDLDPAVVQLSAFEWDMGFEQHDAFLTVGSKLHDPDCEVPTLGFTWHRFLPPVHLPVWRAGGEVERDAPFTSVTQWGWGEFWWDGRSIGADKRWGYLPYLKLPGATGQTFELAANIDPADDTGDRELLLEHGWRLADPNRVARSVSSYRTYIRRSKAEIACCKPIFRELRTGWFSDRSACYLASGRPVLAEDTGFSDRLPVGEGLVAFANLEEAVAGVAEIDAHWERHARAARAIAEEHLDARKVLPAMLEASYEGQSP